MANDILSLKEFSVDGCLPVTLRVSQVAAPNFSLDLGGAHSFLTLQNKVLWLCASSVVSWRVNHDSLRDF